MVCTFTSHGNDLEFSRFPESGVSHLKICARPGRENILSAQARTQDFQRRGSYLAKSGRFLLYPLELLAQGPGSAPRDPPMGTGLL